MPKYIKDDSQDEDLFNIHSKISDTIYNTVKEENISEKSFTLGLLGAWGSGKSLTINSLKEKIHSKTDKILYFEFDVWKYIDNSLYRSILMDFERQLQKYAEKGLIHNNYKIGIKTNEGNNLIDALYKSRQFEVNLPEEPKSFLDRIIAKWESRWYGWVPSIVLLRFFQMLYITFKYFVTRSQLFYFLMVCAIISSSIYYMRATIVDKVIFLQDEEVLKIFKFLAITCIGFSALELFKEAFKDIFKEFLPKSAHNVIITTPPTFAQDQFERIFENVIDEIYKTGQFKFLIVFDNIDRCQPELTLKILTGLKTFLEHKNCFYIIPCDDLRIKEHLNSTEVSSENDFLDKIFSAYLRIPNIENDDRILMINQCLQKADFRFSKQIENKIGQMLIIAYKGETPRQIKRFINDLVSYYRLALNIDQSKQTLLRNIEQFVFMIIIKQKWPDVEKFIMQNQVFFKEYEKYHSGNRLPEDFKQFYRLCSRWIDEDFDPSLFIYLKPSSSSLSKINRILLDGNIEFLLNESIVDGIRNYFSNVTTSGQVLLLEVGIDNLSRVLKDKKLSAEEYIFNDLVEIYFEAIIFHNGINSNSRKEPYFLSEVEFACELFQYIEKFDFTPRQNMYAKLSKRLGALISDNRIFPFYDLLIHKMSSDDAKEMFAFNDINSYNKIHEFIIRLNEIQFEQFVNSQLIIEIVNQTDFTDDIGNKILTTLNKFRNFNARDKICRILTYKIFIMLPQIQAYKGIHPWDPKVELILQLLNEQHWTVEHKNTINNSLYTRITQLLSRGQLNTAINYLNASCNSNFDCISTILNWNGNNNFLVSSNASLLMKNISSSGIKTFFRRDDIRMEFFHIITTNDLGEVLISKFSNEEIVQNLHWFIIPNVNFISNLLQYYQKGSESNDYYNFEWNVFSKLHSSNNDFSLEQFNYIISKIVYNENRKKAIRTYLIKFSENSLGNSERIWTLVQNIDFIDEKFFLEFYEEFKTPLIETNNVEIYKKLGDRLSKERISDFMERLMSVSVVQMKSGSFNFDAMNFIANKYNIHMSVAKIILENFIAELLEASRDESTNEIGVRVLTKLIDLKNTYVNEFRDKLIIIRDSDRKSDKLKNKVSQLII